MLGFTPLSSAPIAAIDAGGVNVYQLDLDAGTFTATAQDATFTISRAHDAGIFSLVGFDAFRTLSKPLDHGSFTLTTQDATFNISALLETATYSLTGFPHNKAISEYLRHVSYSFTGQDATFTITRAHGTGVFNLVGQDALKDISEVAGGAVYTLTGQDVEFNISARLDAATFTLTGFPSFRRYTISRFEADKYEQGFVLRGNSTIEVTNGLPNSVDIEAIDDNDLQLYELTENSVIVTAIENEAA